jgi:hypothetical protein
MKREDIISAARASGAMDFSCNGYTHWSMPNSTAFLIRFAEEIERRLHEVPLHDRRDAVSLSSPDPDPGLDSLGRSHG